MSGYFAQIEALTLDNSFFRRVIFTAKHSQLVLMCLQPNEEIGREAHADVDQFQMRSVTFVALPVAFPS